jgi:hypothetical protein
MVNHANPVGGDVDVQLYRMESEVERSLERVHGVLSENIVDSAVRNEFHHGRLAAAPPVKP